tara:strand:- start:110 stop:337 length:228 start_codon:yes stop_codon:yes gene_type:complete
MIASRAIKVYQSIGSQPEPAFVTTVFTPYDAYKIKDKLFASSSVHRVLFKSVKGTLLGNHYNTTSTYGSKKGKSK